MVDRRVRIVVNMTPQQARIVWGIINGQVDAGSCPDGLTDEEKEACNLVENALSKAFLK